MKTLAKVTTLILLSTTVYASNYTKVAGAFYEDDPFDANVEIFFQGFYKNSTITREFLDKNRAVLIDAKNLDYDETHYQLVPKLEIGVYKDLEIYAIFPIYLLYEKSINFATQTGWKQITMNKTNTYYGQTTEDPNRIIRKIPDKAVRGGFGDMSVGIKWAPFYDQKPYHILKRDKQKLNWDDTMATWVLGIEYTIPTGARYDLDEQAISSNKGDIGNKIQILSFWTAFSKRFEYVDPYFGVYYKLPLTISSSLISGSHKAGFDIGTEIIPYEDVQLGNKFAFDFRLSAAFISNAEKAYSEVAEFLPNFKKDQDGKHILGDDNLPIIDSWGRITATEQYFEFRGLFGISFVIAKYLRLMSNVGFGHDTWHYLTFANSCSEDKNNNGRCSKEEGDIPNPIYEPILDQRGNRIKIADTFIIFWNISMTGQF
ncbi:MAG: hypothetical protein N2746_07640 [Deltaproteobacteria bacterium]|nr:hypothetical protein [Deltaproteobacteria bacterium]